MADAIETVEAKRGITHTEHVLKSVLDGDLESVRSRLIQALERLGYHVTTADPLQARRAARGAARYYMSANILEYPTKLTIGLREVGPGATLATLDYVSEHPGSLSFKGDLHTQLREAEAVIAIAGAERTWSACSSCGTAQSSEGRYCRVCGAPTLNKEPAELEMLRVTAGARAGHHLITTGTLLIALGFLATLVLVLVGGLPGVAVGASLGVLAAGLLLSFLGMAGLSKALDRDASLPNLNAAKDIPQISDTEPNFLQTPSVTEATTNLLARKKEPLPVKRVDTSPLDK